MKKLTKRTISFVLVLAMLIGMAPLWAYALEPSSNILLEETVNLAASAGAKDTYWEVDFKAGKTYTILVSFFDVDGNNLISREFVYTP